MDTRPDAAPHTPVPTRPLSRPNRHLTALADYTADCARAVLPEGRDLFLSIALEPSGLLRLNWWHRDLTPCAELSAIEDGFCDPETAEGLLQRAGLELVDYLAGRWPDNATPDGLGVVTDGHGVAFSPRHPGPLTRDWLSRHAAGDFGLVTILPLATGGPCSLLHQPAASTRVH